MKTLYETYGDKAIFLLVYLREAHPASADQTVADAGWKAVDGTVFHQPTTFQERRKLAETACTFWELNFPALVDTMTPAVGEKYQAWPNRLYLIGTDGKIAYHGVKGPRGVNTHEGELKLRELLGITEGEPVTKAQSAMGPSGRGRMSRPGMPPGQRPRGRPQNR